MLMMAGLTANAAVPELLSIEVGKTQYFVQADFTGATQAPAGVIVGGVLNAGPFSWFAEVQGILPALIAPTVTPIPPATTGGPTVSFLQASVSKTYTIAAIDNMDLAQSETFYTSKSSLDTSRPNGVFHYVVKFASGSTYTKDVTLGADDYPNVPTLTAPAGDWAAGKLTLHAVSGGYQIAWAALTPDAVAPANDAIGIAITDKVSGVLVTELTLPGNTTSYVMPGSLIDPNKDYDIDVTFTHMSQNSTDPDGTILYGLFENVTTFTIHTDPAGATGGVPASHWATVRNGTNATVDIDEQTPGYILAKYSTTGSAAKSYLQFDLTGMTYDPNSPATLRLQKGTSSSSQRIQIWGLNQSYADFSNTVTWNTAQANDTASNGMLTSGPASATLLADLQASGGDEIVLFPPWGQFVLGNKLTLAITTSVAIAGDTNASNGYRVAVAVTTAQPTVTLPTLRFSAPVAAAAQQPQLAVARNSANGNFQISFTATPGTGYSVLTSTDMALPMSSWTLLGVPTESPAGTYVYTDTDAVNHPRRFYVVRKP